MASSMPDVEPKKLIGTLIHYIRLTARSLSDPRHHITVNIRNRYGDHSQRIFTPADYLTRLLAERLISEGADKKVVTEVLREFQVPDVAFPGDDDEVLVVVR
jgi:hypothetical protein